MAEQPGAPEKPAEKTALPQKAAVPEKTAGPGKAPEKAATPAKTEEKAGTPAKDGKIEALEKRILELEARNGGRKWIAALAAAALVCAVIALVCAVTLSRPPPPPKVIQAEGIQLNDAQGRFRAEIGEIDSGWGFSLFDRSAAEAQTGSPAAGAPPQIEIRIGHGDNHVIVRGLAPHKSVVDLGVNKLGWPSVILFDKENAARRAVLGETEVPSEDKLEKRAPDSVVLSDQQGAPIWKAGETADDFAPVAPVLPATPGH